MSRVQQLSQRSGHQQANNGEKKGQSPAQETAKSMHQTDGYLQTTAISFVASSRDT
jgi:hypothetical protein